MTDDELRAALDEANIPVLLMLLVHFTGDFRWIEAPYRPSRNRGLGDNDTGGLDPARQAQVRAAALTAIRGWLTGTPLALPMPSPADLARMLGAAMGEEVPPEYGGMIAAELVNGQAEDLPFSRPRAVPAGLSAIIIGAGVTGLCATIALHEAGIPCTVIEANDDVGGVWQQNTYPGVGVDTPSHLYSYSFARHDWHHYFASQIEIMQYLRDVTDRYRVRPLIRFGTTATRAVYDERARTWTVDARGPGGDVQQLTARILISSVGVFNPPKYPDIAGLHDFAGRLVHSAQWPADLQLDGANVAVIGNGASAMQIVPAIASTVESLTIYQRSPQWVAPFEKFRREVPPGVRLLLREIPLYRTWYRLRLGWMFNDRSQPAITVDPSWPGHGRSINVISENLRDFFTRYMEDELGGRKDLLPSLVPDYPPYGKRILLDNGWYRTLTRDNVELVAAAVEKITPGGVVDATGAERAADTIVLATGFDAASYLSTFEVTGRNGLRLADFWGDDPRAFLSVAIPGFPNFFTLYGPNTQPHGGSVIFTVEAQVSYLSGLLQQMADQGYESLECRRDVWARYGEEVAAEHEKLLWRHAAMRTYFRNEAGHVVVLSPYRMVDVWRSTRNPRLGDYVTEPEPSTLRRVNG